MGSLRCRYLFFCQKTDRTGNVVPGTGATCCFSRGIEQPLMQSGKWKPVGSPKPAFGLARDSKGVAYFLVDEICLIFPP